MRSRSLAVIPSIRSSIVSRRAAGLALAALLLASCNASPKPAPEASAKTYRTSISHAFSVVDIPAGAREVSLWVPVPPDTEFQRITGLRIEPAAAIGSDAVYGNRIAHYVWRAPFDKTLEVTLSYDLERREEAAHAEALPSTLRARYLAPDTLGVIDARIQRMAAQATAGKEGTMARARAIYDYVLAHMTYDKTTPGWGRGDTARACDTPSGNCSDFHALFISLARAAGIPARFHYGYSIKPAGEIGAHCWAQFWDDKEGWVPVDISEADKDPAKTEYFFGRLSENRVVYTTGRDLILSPPQKGGPLNFLIDPYVEIDGKAAGKVTAVSRHAGDTMAWAR